MLLSELEKLVSLGRHPQQIAWMRCREERGLMLIPARSFSAGGQAPPPAAPHRSCTGGTARSTVGLREYLTGLKPTSSFVQIANGDGARYPGST